MVPLPVGSVPRTIEDMRRALIASLVAILALIGAVPGASARDDEVVGDHERARDVQDGDVRALLLFDDASDGLGEFC